MVFNYAAIKYSKLAEEGLLESNNEKVAEPEEPTEEQGVVRLLMDLLMQSLEDEVAESSEDDVVVKNFGRSRATEKL